MDRLYDNLYSSDEELVSARAYELNSYLPGPTVGGLSKGEATTLAGRSSRIVCSLSFVHRAMQQGNEELARHVVRIELPKEFQDADGETTVVFKRAVVVPKRVAVTKNL